MNSNYHRTNLLLFTLERCDNWNCDTQRSTAWRVVSHKILGFHPVWGPFYFTRVSAILSWLAHVWEQIVGRDSSLK
jgi:hypothetical protein